MLDGEGAVIGGTMSNVFAVRAGRLSTPDLSRCGVAGIIRSVVLDIAAAVTGLSPSVARLTMTELGEAEEMFLSNSVIGIWPVHTLDGARLRVGEVAGALLEALSRAGAIADADSTGRRAECPHETHA